MLLSLNMAAFSAMYKIDNPADSIKNPAEKIHNPASEIKNPAANIYNPASRMNDPNPLSPPTQSVSQPTVTEVVVELPPAVKTKEKPAPTLRQAIPHKSYHFKTAKAYLVAAKKAFSRDDYREFISITQDALRRIRAGSLQASAEIQQKLSRYETFGYGLLENN
ncbi:MAG TPA: hypothetical protein HPP94_10840 [Desulfuromonadales bacterium]|nr:hypothetical protein [Desulfuromonadales bacterium]